MPQTIRKAVIPAAGLGTRLLPASKAVPKEMLPIVDTPTIQLVIEEAVAAGIRDIVVVTGRHKSAIEEHFDHAFELEAHLRARGKVAEADRMAAIAGMVNLVTVRQKQPLGLGHAILAARPVVGDEPFAVLLPDDLFDGDARPGIGQLVDVHQETGASVVGLLEVPAGQEHLYGIVTGPRDATGRLRVTDMVEKPPPGTAPSRFAIIGRYVLSPDIWPLLERGERGVGGEIQLTDAIRGLLERPPGVLGLPMRGRRHDAGDRLGLIQANLEYALLRPSLREPLLAFLRDLLAREDPT